MPLQTNSIIIKKALHYLRSKQSKDGGFCSYNMEFLEESNPHDTFFAVLAFQTLGKPVLNRDRVVQYLQAALAKAQVFNYIFFPLWTLYQIGALTIDESLKNNLAELPILLPDRPSPEDAGETCAGSCDGYRPNLWWGVSLNGSRSRIISWQCNRTAVLVGILT